MHSFLYEAEAPDERAHVRETININGRDFPVVNGEATRELRSLSRQAPPAAGSPPPKRKYGNRHVIIGSEHFDSEKEGRRHLVLLEMQKRGEIRNLKRQVWFKLVVNGDLIGKVRPDWTYEKDQGPALRASHRWVKVAEDAKGYPTRDWATRWRLAKALHPEIEWRVT